MPRTAAEAVPLTPEERETVEKNLGIAYEYVLSFAPKWLVARYPSERDAIQVCILALINSVKYLDDRAKLTTLAYTAMYHELLAHANQGIVRGMTKSKAPTVLPIDEGKVDAFPWSVEDLLDKLLEAVQQKFEGLDLQIAVALVHGRKSDDIRAEYGVSRHYVKSVKRRALTLLPGFSEEL